MFATIKGLQLNGFKEVKLPSKKDLYSRLGKRVSRSHGSDESIPLQMDKLSSLEYMDNLDRDAQREEMYALYKAEQAKVREESQSHDDE